MNKNKILIWTIVVIVSVILLGFAFLIFQNNQSKNIEPVVQTNVSPTPSPIPLITYQNPSGFEFQHLKSFQIKEQDDKQAYANILIQSEKLTGQMTFKVTDTKFKSADDWLKNENILSNSSNKKTIPFADITATQIATPGGMLAVSIDKGDSS